jgi:ribose transport system substrate-binding protein
MKKVLVFVLALIFVMAAAVGCGPQKSADTGNDEILIGVSIWSSTDPLGSQCKQIIDAAADALGVKTMYVDQSHISEQVTASAETLAAAGCDGIIICNAADSEMTSVINTCNENEVYLAQFFRIISKDNNPDIYAAAESSKYYVGCVHEGEQENGYKLGKILLEEKGCRKIGMISWAVGDATALARIGGYKSAVDEWNDAHPDDQAVLLDTIDDVKDSAAGRSAAEALMSANPDLDAIVVAGGGGDPLGGAIAAIESAGKTGQIHVASTDFTPTLGEQLDSGAISAMSGGHYADPLFAFMMVYNAIKGNYQTSTDGFYEVIFPYCFVASGEDYNNYAKYFVDELPYNKQELIDMAGETIDELKATAAKLSIEDVASRHQ